MAKRDEIKQPPHAATSPDFHDMSIRRKLIMIIMIISSAAVLLAGATTVVYQHIESRQQMAKDLSTHARMIADDCLAALDVDAPGDVEVILKSLKAKPSVAYAYVYDKNGEVLAVYREADFKGEPLEAPDPGRHRYTMDWLVVSTPMGAGEEARGGVFIQSDLAGAKRSMKKSAGVIVGIMVVVLILAYALSYRLQKVISDPVLRLTEIAATISENKDYSIRAAPRGKDELGALTDSFNLMLEKIEKSDLALRENEERYRSVFENTGTACCIIDENCVITMCNSMFEKLCGFSRGEIEKVMLWHDLVTNDEKMRLLKYQKQRVIRTGAAPEEYECDFIDRTGKRKQIHVMTTFIPGGNNRVVSVQDITERVKAAEELKRHRDQLGEMVRERTADLAKINKELQREFARRGQSEEMYSKAFHSGGVLMTISAQYGCRIMEANNRFLNALGYDREEVIGKTAGEIDLYADRGTRNVIFTKMREIGRIRDLDVDIRAKNGELRRGLLSADALQLGDQECMLTVIIDVTRRKRSEDALKSAKQAAEAAARAKSRFLADMSHEITTSLNEITGFSELLSTLVTDQKRRNYLDVIKTAGKSLLNLMSDILDLSKIEVGMMKIERERVNPGMIFNEIEQIFAARVAEKGLEFIIDIDEDLPSMLLLDETRLRQVLVNLMDNAVKYTPKGSIRLAVGKKSRTNDGRRIDLIISVEDTGLGIPEEDLETLFDSFKRRPCRNAEKEDGPGLGLAISKKLVALMGGRIAVSGEYGAGAAFEITLRNVRAASPEAAAADEKLLDMENFTYKGHKVLVVDDVRSNRGLIKKMLTDVDLEVLTAENGEEAILVAEEYQPDAIIMDIRMPVMDGLEATKRLKKSDNTKKIPVIALTATGQFSHEEEVREAGLDGYLLKPVDKQELLGEVARCLSTAETA
ncbi:MAG: PAS domain S-box protein [Desulfobacterales bacterium]|nr:PAS domain S-box protein [Desulfobacterales bacterium]